jgi:hemerythrin superfamily protein
MDIKLLDTLEQQHRKVEGLFSELENAEQAEEQQPLVDELARSLSEHMQIEETEVYPELSRLDQEMGEEATIEHGLARAGLDRLKGLIGQPGFGAAVAMLQAGVAHHVQEEENEAFPKLRKVLGGPFELSDATRDELYEEAKKRGVEGRSHMTKDELAAAITK